jgi:hypothetical protein
MVKISIQILVLFASLSMLKAHHQVNQRAKRARGQRAQTPSGTTFESSKPNRRHSLSMSAIAMLQQKS